MARTTYVEKARASKKDRTCFTCNQPIEAGQAYAHNQPNRWSMRYQWHRTCAMPPASLLESNDKRAAAMAAFEDAYSSLDEIDTEGDTVQDDVEALISTAADGVREAAEMWREGAQAIEDGFGHSTYQSEEMTEHADVYDGVADTIESIDVGMGDEDPLDLIERVREELGSAEGDLD